MVDAKPGEVQAAAKEVTAIFLVGWGIGGLIFGALGGAINVITRLPSNDFHVKALASYAGPDNAWIAGASISGPICAPGASPGATARACSAWLSPVFISS